MNENPIPLQPGMVTSNEPGVYKAGSHGIRTENLLLTVPAGEGMFGNYLKFETITLCPICRKGIIKELLTAEEIEWLNEYHRVVYEKLSPDLENDENVRSPQQRDKLERWLKNAVLKLGAADDRLDVVYIGTILHYDSVLARFLKNPLWNRQVFKAIIQWPDRMDLWEQFEGLLLGAETPQEGEAAAMAMYREQQAEMDKGAVVSWPALRPIHKLMIRRAREGHSAFDSEQPRAHHPP